MKTSTKAILLSAFVFPGAGQLYLKRYRQGLIIMLLAIAGLGYIIWRATIVALSSIDRMAQSGNVSVREMKDIVAAQSAGTSPYDNIIPLVIICLWIIGIVDAYISGKRKDLQDAAVSKS
jgi:TM2 domain-containing membrane protein YozV